MSNRRGNHPNEGNKINSCCVTMVWVVLLACAILNLVVLLLLTPYPKQWGVYRAIVDVVYYPLFVGMTPSFYYGEEWKFPKPSQPFNNTLLQGQHALVTGANSGIGYSIVKGLAQFGASSVTLACRNANKCEDAIQRIQKEEGTNAENVEFQTLIMDMSSLSSVQRGAQQFRSTMEHQGKSLDMLFLNAGTLHTDISHSCVPVQEDGLEYVFVANYLGHHLLYRLLEPLLLSGRRRSSTAIPARVVSTSSAHSWVTYKYKVATDVETLNGCSESFRILWSLNKSYGQTKLAQILWTQQVTEQLQKLEETEGNADAGHHSIYVNSFHPGMVDTSIWPKVVVNMHGTTTHSWKEQLKQLQLDFTKWFRRDFMWSSDDGAWTGLFLGTQWNYLQTNDIRGANFHPQGERITNHPFASDILLQQKLWDFSESLIQKYLPTESEQQSEAEATTDNADTESNDKDDQGSADPGDNENVQDDHKSSYQNNDDQNELNDEL